MNGASRWFDSRRTVIGCAVACYGAALVIAVAAARLPDSLPGEVPAALPAAPAVVRPAVPAPPPVLGTVEDGEKAGTGRPTPPPEAAAPGSWEQDLFALAQQQRQSGDVAGAEASYLRLLREGRRRDEAARKLGELYVRAGDYRRAEAMYLESARLLKERRN
jgi:tetratricopeptide (TPR) repeat protein